MNKMKSAIVFGDIHFPNEDKNCIKLIKQVISDNNFDEIILNGDIIDGNQLSPFVRTDKFVDLETELKMFKKFVDELRILQPSSKIVIIGCNHFDIRLMRYINENIDIDCIKEEITPEKLLNKYKIKYDKKIPYNKIYYPFGQKKLGIIHGNVNSIYFSKKYAEMYPCDLIVGHSHTTQIYKSYNNTCYGIGCLCDLNLPYLNGNPTRWNHSFATINFFENVFVNIHEIKNYSTIVNGKLYDIKW